MFNCLRRIVNVVMTCINITGIPDGDIFAFATQKDFNFRGNNISGLYDIIDNVAGDNQFRNAEANSAYALITVKGEWTSTTTLRMH